MENANEANQKFPKAAVDLVDVVSSILLRVIQAMIAGDSQLILARSTQEWLKLANDSLPLFAKFITGEPCESRQHIARDTKVLDAYFEVAIAAYNHFSKIGAEERARSRPKAPPNRSATKGQDRERGCDGPIPPS